jgi:hypothetical protein
MREIAVHWRAVRGNIVCGEEQLCRMNEIFIMLTALTQCSVCVSACISVRVCVRRGEAAYTLITHSEYISLHTYPICHYLLFHLHLIFYFNLLSSTSTWSVGSLGEILRTDDGGLSWLSLSSRLPYAVKGASIVFHSLSTLSPSGMTSSSHTLSLFFHPLHLSIYCTMSSRSCLSLTSVRH